MLLLPAFVMLGLWQLRKAEAAAAVQAELDACAVEAPLEMPVTAIDATRLRHRRVVLRGVYDGDAQILIDNRIHFDRAGYHVVTPLRLDGADMRVVVNRGWVPAGPDRRRLPEVPAPSERVEITGIAVVPPTRFFTLGDATGPTSTSAVWQNLDLERLRRTLRYPVQPVLVQLDAAAPGGYVRDWPRADAHGLRNLGYAWQWFGFALASLGIWVYLLVRRR